MKIQLPDHDTDEVYLCGLILPTGALQHTIVVPGDAEPDSWDHQMQWAHDDGFDLLNRIEHAFAWEKARGLFDPVEYWSNTPNDNPDHRGAAWYQHFGYGFQENADKNCKLYARRCRRVIVQGE
ncbi:MAG: DUF1566 domain-containing protein [Pseudomonadota bacterium]|nr:DUF1566 domain-containing protein [Pseudomonadota bacterium]